MVNGSVPDATHPASWSAVALVDRSTGEHFCSGTLIAPQLIVTAAHCVFDRRPEDFQVLFGMSTRDSAAVRLNAVAKETFKKFQKFESNFDIAWVRFEGAVPSPFKPIEIWHHASLLEPSKPLSIAGYGRTASQCSFDDPTCQGGNLQFVDTKVREFVNHGRLFNLIVIGPRPDHGPCFGDSGGPAYVRSNGKWYLVGDFMGWDRILVPEELDTICDTGEAIYNFVGDFVAWIEESSGQRLTYDDAQNPRQTPSVLPQLTEVPETFAGWCAYNNHEDPAWFTVQRLIRLASDYRATREDPARARELFEDCAVAEIWVKQMIADEKRLVIPGFDPVNFIDSARLEDVRPLASLAGLGLEELVLSDHSIADLSPLTRLTSLKRLEIIDNTLPSREESARVPALRINAFPALEDLRIHNSYAPIDFDHLDQLHNLKVLELSYITSPQLQGLAQLPLVELRLDSVTTATTVDLPELSRLKKLFLSKMAVGRLSTRMPQLESLELLEVSQLSQLPLEAPRLQRFFLYASDYPGRIDVGAWKGLQELSIVANSQLREVGPISDMPRLNLLEIVENQLDILGPISRLPRLKALSLMQNGLRHIPALVDLPALEKIDLDGNRIEELGTLPSLNKLEYLNLSRNPLKHLRGLEGLGGLRRLSLQNERGKGLASLEGMKNLPVLEEVNVARNSIRAVDPLLSFPTLKVVVLSDNFVEDISGLRALPELEYVEVVNNPLKSRDCPITKPQGCRFEWIIFGGGSKLTAPVLKESVSL
jgi:internalin A